MIGSEIVERGRVYFATSDTGLLHALDASSAASLGTLENRRWPTFSSPAVAGDTVYFGSMDGHVYAVH